MEHECLNDDEFQVFDVIATCIIDELTEILNFNRQRKKLNSDNTKGLLKLLINARNQNQLEAYDNIYVCNSLLSFNSILLYVLTYKI